ncbi:MAG: GNAT family N-acetyltransferase [Brasilonema octagenarum HA4186-MV1]|jgi:ribosomal protein S18 acetylase RimI-like enzyme|uniref:GNAT family N-acetyltransferase n=2 Tax=Brasilonema TaxID=383614 RepID=A0A856MAZ5_9CYAN|nr:MULTISPECIES: GNAT family N-acetyltransferase [Brasilonema]MBW4628553.1 GNAT family N-acetyltransferase [Brasilonema octagenarum HA4186-MV1]NMF65803.1 GNAT family N-acetyltransferase [Brasilonema octagenarum UFV-OR1]QDL06891.1 GNAT family N-acetyltransferase [Brasilonema sennae CENA114]QDL13255.1 GNAT family N-acetyltransferase [Brasilonema octagenarum UFV-E1]
MAARMKMTSLLQRNLSVIIRQVQYRDLDGIERLTQESFAAQTPKGACDAMRQMQWLRGWYGLLKCLSWFPNPLRYRFYAYVAEQGRTLLGMIQISPFNRTHSTWRVERVMVERAMDKQAIGSQLLRYCFESILEARTWLLEVNVNDKDALALYRKNGFQRLAEMTYWEIQPELLEELAKSEPDLPNLLPVSNADAQLLYQLDTASMPPLVRQVFDRNADDFKTTLFGALTEAVKQWVTKVEVVSGYVFEPQRKAAIGYFQLRLDRKGQQPHVATLTVNPAYTWLYPELLTQLARIAQDFPPQALQVTSADYHPEREEFLERMGASRTEHTLMMSRSVWHKLRESKFVSLEGIQLPEMLQGLQPARKPIPGGMSWVQQGQPVSPERIAQPNTTKETIVFSCNNSNVETSSQQEPADARQE